MLDRSVVKDGGGLSPFQRVMSVLNKPIVVGSDRSAGLSAEELVERSLATLPGSCNVVREVALPGGRGRIGRIVLSMGGIFTIVSVGDGGVVTFDGTRLRLDGRPFEVDLLSQAQAEATALKDHLAVVTGGEACMVEPVIVFTRAALKVQSKAKGVRLVPLRRLITELISVGSRMPAEKRERITGALLQLKAGSGMRRG